MKTASYEEFISKGVLLLLNTPEHMDLNFDNLTIKTGSKFKGIKMVPLGTHYLHFSLKEQNHMFKISQFIQFGEEDKIKVLKWSDKGQDFFPFHDEASIQGVKQLYFDCYLVPYDETGLSIWKETCSFINKRVLSKLDPVNNIQNISQEYGQANVVTNEDGEVIEEKDTTKEVSKFKVMKGTIFYSQIPKKLQTDIQSTTNINLDKTPLLKRVLVQYKSNPIDILGELQYSFISFLLGENLESLDQWKKILNLLSFSEEGISQYNEIYMNFIIVLYNQIKQLPLDFFKDQLSKDSFIVGCLIRLQEYSLDQKMNNKFRARIKKLLEMVKSNFKFEVPMEEEEDMPTVLENYEYL